MFKEAQGLEKHEREIASYIHLEFVRHGESNYRAIIAERAGEKDLEKYLPDLTEQGIKTMKNAGERIISKLNREFDDVYILSSTEIRARGSAKIIEDMLVDGGIKVHDNHPFSEINEAESSIGDKNQLQKLQSAKLLQTYDLPPQIKNNFLAIRDKLENPNMSFERTWRLHAGSGDFEDIESPKQIASRLKDLFLDTESSKESMERLKLKRRQFAILVSHNIFFDPLIEALFDEGITKGSALTNGESIGCDFVREKDTIKFSFRGREITLTLNELLNLLDKIGSNG